MSISTFGNVLSSETLWASDPVAEQLDELQFDLGEGPCWDAAATRRPVLEGRMSERGHLLWPAFTGALRDEHIQGLFAFPLLLGPLTLGAIDLYANSVIALHPRDVSGLLAASAALARLVLRRAVDLAEAQDSDTQTKYPHSRRVIHQATGFIIAQTGLSADDAYLVIQGRAFADGRRMRGVAEDILTGQVVFTTKHDGIEDTS